MKARNFCGKQTNHKNIFHNCPKYIFLPPKKFRYFFLGVWGGVKFSVITNTNDVVGRYDFYYMNTNLSLLGSKWSKYALLIGFEVRQTNASLLAELQEGQHFRVAILYGVKGGV